ncbi:hypothetical protein [Agrobacterium cavarae]
MQTLWKVLFWIFMIFVGVPVFGILLTLVLSTFTDFKVGGDFEPRSVSVLTGQPVSTSPPAELVDALSFFSSLTDVKKNDIKNTYRGKLVQWTLPVWEVSAREDTFVIQTSADGTISTFCRVKPASQEETVRIKNIAAGESITCKGVIAGYTLGSVNLSPATVVH